MPDPKPPKTSPSPDIRGAPMDLYRTTRAGIDPAVLGSLKKLIEARGKDASPLYPPAGGGKPAEGRQGGEAHENISRQKTYETVLKFMTLSKGSKEFMKQISDSLSRLSKN